MAMTDETLEEAAENAFDIFQNENPIVPHKHIDPFKLGFMKGAKWQAERMYSKEDMQEYAEFCIQCFIKNLPCIVAEDWFKQFKKKAV
jgi:hypothetical protein